LINQWKDEIINGFRLSTQILANMNKKVRSKYGADPAAATTAALNDGNTSLTYLSLEKISSEEV
jgi:hypothetical protein